MIDGGRDNAPSSRSRPHGACDGGTTPVRSSTMPKKGERGPRAIAGLLNNSPAMDTARLGLLAAGNPEEPSQGRAEEVGNSTRDEGHLHHSGCRGIPQREHRSIAGTVPTRPSALCQRLREGEGAAAVNLQGPSYRD
jgi:hypothetical protein